MRPFWYVIGALLLIALLCAVLAPKRVVKEMCINADVMDSEHFGEKVECD